MRLSLDLSPSEGEGLLEGGKAPSGEEFWGLPSWMRWPSSFKQAWLI